MVGVLALQGGFEKHKKVLDIIGAPNLFVKNEKDLFNTKALIIPGGESSTLSLLMDKFFLRKSILKYSEQYSVFGTCAGMIMLSSTKSVKNKVKTLNVMDFSVSRNSWGSQVFSFEEKINLKNFNILSFNSIFIRAPKVSKVGKKIVRYDFFKDEIVILEDGMHLACSFHPEIEGDIRIHQYFLNKYYYGRS